MKKIILCLLLFISFTSVKAADTYETYTFDLYITRPGNQDFNSTKYKFTYGNGNVEYRDVDIHLRQYIPRSWGTTLKVEEISCDPKYVFEGNVYEFNFIENPNAIIRYTYKINEVTIKWSAFYINAKDKEMKLEYHPNLEFYQKSYNNLVLKTNEAEVKLPAGDYIVKDTLMGTYHYFSLLNDGDEFVIYHNLINSIQSNKKINSFCNEEECFKLYYSDGTYIFEEPIIPGLYKINGIDYYIDDTLPKIEGAPGISVIINLLDDEELPPEENDSNKEEINNNKNDEQTSDKELDNNTNIEVEVPDTGLVTNFKVDYDIEKKRYNFNNSNINNITIS